MFSPQFLGEFGVMTRAGRRLRQGKRKTGQCKNELKYI